MPRKKAALVFTRCPCTCTGACACSPIPIADASVDKENLPPAKNAKARPKKRCRAAEAAAKEKIHCADDKRCSVDRGEELRPIKRSRTILGPRAVQPQIQPMLERFNTL
jgi:hypothetical protein